MKIGCLLSVREKATRLPKKVLLDLVGEPVTAKLLKRLQQAEGIDKVILSTSTHQDDEVLVKLAEAMGVDAFQGSEDDKLQRYYDTAMAFSLDGVVIVDGDDPLCFPEAISTVARELRSSEVDCVYMTGLPLGAAATALSTKALKKVLEIKAESDTEVWGGYFIGSGFFNTKEITLPDPLLNHPELRLTLDYQEDFDLIKSVYQEFNGRDDFTSYEVMDLLINKKPDLANINASAQEKYEQHINSAAPVRFK